MTNPIIPIILSGGAGTRLWPMSRESHPKPFMKLPTGRSLLQETFMRACAIDGVETIITITNHDYYLKSKAEYHACDIAKSIQTDFILEPCARNTAAAVTLAALNVRKQYGDNATILVLPADHLISPTESFIQTCQRAQQLANEDYIVTFGMQPNRAETGYGYIQCADSIQQSNDSYIAKRFVEKPNLELAQQYLKSGDYLWNSGMFCFNANVIIEQLTQHAPDILLAAQQCLNKSSTTQPGVVRLSETLFNAIPATSIDYAVMEKSNHIAVVRSTFDWQDIGSWEAYKDLFPTDEQGNTILGEAILIDSDHNFIHSETRVIASIGINNLAVIDTPDAMLITQRDRVQDVKEIVQQLKTNQHESYATHRTVIRPWGTYTVLEEGPCFKIKRIEVQPGASLSLQLHHQRSEHWVVVDGTANIIIGNHEYTLSTNESTFVPINTPHRLSNQTESPLIIIEVQTGAYLGEDDIVRMDDHYGRTEVVA